MPREALHDADVESALTCGKPGVLGGCDDEPRHGHVTEAGHQRGLALDLRFLELGDDDESRVRRQATELVGMQRLSLELYHPLGTPRLKADQQHGELGVTDAWLAIQTHRSGPGGDVDERSEQSDRRLGLTADAEPLAVHRNEVGQAEGVVSLVLERRLVDPYPTCRVPHSEDALRRRKPPKTGAILLGNGGNEGEGRAHGPVHHASTCAQDSACERLVDLLERTRRASEV